MSIQPCIECGGQVSTRAKVCPHCGVRYTGWQRASTGGRIGFVLFVWLPLVLIGSLAGMALVGALLR
jgi:hypothetical protein